MCIGALRWTSQVTRVEGNTIRSEFYIAPGKKKTNDVRAFPFTTDISRVKLSRTARVSQI